MEPDSSKPAEPPPQLPVLSGSREVGQTQRLSDAIVAAEARLRPCGAKTGTAELVACLALVAPTGMREEERQQWLAVARQTLKGMPEDLLRLGAQHARENATHPAQVVAMIVRHVKGYWDDRKRTLGQLHREQQELLPPPKHEAVPREVTRRILQEVGLKMEQDDGAKDS